MFFFVDLAGGGQFVLRGAALGGALGLSLGSLSKWAEGRREDDLPFWIAKKKVERPPLTEAEVRAATD